MYQIPGVPGRPGAGSAFRQTWGLISPSALVGQGGVSALAGPAPLGPGGYHRSGPGCLLVLLASQWEELSVASAGHFVT